MNFLNNLILWFIPVVVLAVLLLIWRARVRRSQVLKSLLGVRWNDPEHVLISPARRSLRLWLFIAGILLLMAAVARPYWGSQLIPYEARGRDVMILFDVSKSMLSEDIQPSRLEHAKWLLRQLVNDSNGDRFGLVAFAGNAFLECPMTTDKTSFIQYVDELSTSSIPLGGTNLQLALETAVKAFDAAESSNRAIVLITDGDELSGDSSRVLDALRNQKIPLFIVGLGDPANPAVIPIKRGPGETPAFMRDAAGNLVKTKLNEQQLVKLAKETGGIYVRSTVTDPGLDQIRQRIKALVPKDMDKGIRTRPIERLYYPLGLSLALLLVWFILSERETPLRPRKALLLFLLPGLLIAASGAKAADNDAAAVTDKAQPAAALPSDTADETSPAVQDKKSAKDKPAAALPDAVKTYNEGHDLQLRKDENAAKLYEQAINMSEKNPAVRARAYQNLGVIEHNKARQEMMQSVEQVKGQNLDGALEKLSGSEKILDKAEEMYVKSMSIKTVQPDTGKSAKDSKNPEVKKTAEDQKTAESGTVQLERNRAEVAIDQQKLLFDRDMIAALRKKIEELKKKQEEARKKTEEARKQQQQKQDQKQDQNKQDQNKQDQNKQDQNKQDQNKQDQNKQDQNKQDQNKQDQNKQDQNKQEQKQNADQAMKDAKKSVDELKDQAKKLEQKKIEQNAEDARKELDKAEEAKKESKPEKADKHMKEALKYLGADDNNKNDKNDKNKNGGEAKDKKDQDKQNQQDKKDQKDKKDQDKQNQQDRKQNDQPAQARAAQQEKEIDPQQAKALLEVMAGKEKNLRDALKEQQQKMYGQIKVEKDW